MIGGKRVLAVIPARGGSKRLPRKNILDLGGKPVISWTIDSARKSKYIDKVLVSTDSKEIFNISQIYKAWVPELRPDELSSDSSSTQDVLNYIIDKYGKEFDIVIVLQPTSPFRDNFQIDEALELQSEKDCYSIVSVTPCEHPPVWSNTLPDDLSLDGFISKSNNKRSQDIKKYYRLNGAIYIYSIKKLKQEGGFYYNSDTYAYEMDNNSSVDIDSRLDFDFAEFLCGKYCL